MASAAPATPTCGPSEPTVASLDTTATTGAPPIKARTRYPESGIWGSSANDIWVVGANGFGYHYNGTTWQPTSSQSLTNHDLTGVWSDRKGNVWAVGNSSVGAGTIFKY